MFFVAGIILAIIQLGIERNKGILDFSFGLPFHRRTIFRSKVFIGALVIWGSQFISFVISLCLIAILRPDVGSFYSEYLMSTLTCFMLYMLMLAAGTMTGSVIAQLMVGLSASILPMLLFLLIYAHFEMIFRNHTSTSLFQSISTLVSYVTPLFYVSREFIRNPMIILPLILTGLFYWIGIICFDKLPNEREGYFFLLEKMNKPIQLLVIAIGLLGFGLFGYAVTNSLFGYFIGMVIGAIIGFFLSYFLIFKKSKLF
jgi:acetoin utilization transport system permease protein